MERICSLLASITEIVFPRRCVGCGRERESVCIICLSRVPLASKTDSAGSLQAGIIDKEIVSVFDYRNSVMRTAIWRLKYRSDRTIADNLGRMLHEYLIDDMSERALFTHFSEPLLIPIPSAKKRIRSRGFNQAELLAQRIKLHDKGNNFTLVTDAIEKIRNTIPQAKIKNKNERLRNLHGAFMVTRPEKIRGRNIILIDDVVTTGATISEVKRTLKKAGAKKVIGLTVAH